MRTRSRAGFSLVELLVALTVLNVGLLALVAGSAAVVRRHNAIHARAAAARVAASRLERLAAEGCAALSGSTATVDGTEAWTVTIPAPTVREMVELVKYAAPTGTAVISLRTRAPC